MDHMHDEQEDEGKRSSRLPFIISVAALALLTFGVAVGLLWIGKDRAARQYGIPQQEAIAESVSKAATLESTVLFTGDIYWGRYTNKVAQRSPLKEAYPFSRLHEFERDKYDAWVGNLECPSVPGVNQPYDLEANKLIFNCPSTYLPEFAKWFTAVSLANNHTSNQKGQTGLDATRTALDKYGVQYFGHFDPAKLEDVCEVTALPVRTTVDGAQKPTKLPVALCGFHGLGTGISAESLAVMKRYSALMPVVAYPHMGTEYSASVDDVRRSLYRSMIDNGADVVIGAHPHWVQPAEAYKGKLIAYSVGNFMFDQKPGETSRGAAIKLLLKTTQPVPTDRMEAWTKLGETCALFHDACLQAAEQQKLERLPLSFSYDVVGVDMSGDLTHRAGPALQEVLLQRLNWKQVAPELR